ncbi:MAG: hypothetical protein KDJ65_15685 [Anaerolineae bacterium]|nr:hypothetical protein [Anaerolineae bacterium]
MNQFGWFWLGFTMIFFWIFGALTSINGIYFLISDTETAPGIVTEIKSTSASENETPVYATHYAFRVERLEMEMLGHSYTTGRRFSPNENVTIEYIRDNPEISRIQGTRTGTFSPWVFCFIGLFPAVGIAFVTTGLVSGWRANHLLTHGKVALGRLVDKSPTNTRINDKPVYKLTFAFTADDGRTHHTIARSHQPYSLEDEEEEQLLYDPHRPSRAVLLDNLPGQPTIDETGLIAADYRHSMLVFLLPLIVLATNGIALILAMAL